MTETLNKAPSRQRAKLLEGAPIAKQIKSEVALGVKKIGEEHSIRPSLAAIRVGDDPASEIYVRKKIEACAEVGIRSELHDLSASTNTIDLLDLISSLNERNDIDGILVQLPLPAEIEEVEIIEAVAPAKDVDGFHPLNVGRLAIGQPAFVPCTPAGILELLDRNNFVIRGANACIVGRSQIVGRPVAQLLLQRDATVTICHSRTRDLASITSKADILVVAMGRAGFIGGNHIKPGAIVVDVGVNKVTDEVTARSLFGAELERRLEALEKRGYTTVGDVNPVEADAIAGWRTPVPGGVGLLTVAMLMSNTLKAARMRRGL
jgi:methylenetetrahydrofolate dehydrogenase (NADP+) / methenyltetrahydrofolate cyclohydrolase